MQQLEVNLSKVGALGSFLGVLRVKKHFLKCLSGHEKPLIDGKDGLKVVEIIEAARQSSLDNKQVKVVYENSED